MSLASCLAKAFRDTGQHNKLHFAVMRNDIKYLQDFWHSKPSDFKNLINQKNPQGRTPIWLAVASDYDFMVEWLFSNQEIFGTLDLKTVDVKSHCLVMAAVKHNAYKSLKILLEKGKLDPNGNENSTLVPLSIAAREGFIECLILLLKHNAIVDGREDMYKYGILDRIPPPNHPFMFLRTSTPPEIRRITPPSDAPPA